MMTADIEKKKEYLEYYKTVFPKRITDNITLDVDSNGDFYPDYYWLLENMLTFHKMAMKICEPSTEFEFGWYFKYYLDFLSADEQIIYLVKKYLKSEQMRPAQRINPSATR